MKRSFVFILMITAFAIAALTIGSCQQRLFDSRQSSGSIMGTWQAASYKYGAEESNFMDFLPNQRRIKLITETHFTWVAIDTATRKVRSSAGGTYSLNRNIYTESIDFGLGMDRYLRQKQTFTIKVEGDMFFLSGYLSDGLKIEEIWQRVK